VCGILGLAISKFDRDDEPAGKDTMSWGLISAVGTAHHDTPDVIYDEGSPGKEAMIRVLGRDPGDVSGKVIRIARALK
jgi:predicted fused transcriptional regulator/phosphomethylpyrimidine kinase